MTSIDENNKGLLKLWIAEQKLLVQKTIGFLMVNCLLLLAYVTIRSGATRTSVLQFALPLVGLGFNGLWIYLGASSWAVARSIHKRLASGEIFAKLWDGSKVVYCYLIPGVCAALWLGVLFVALANIHIHVK